MRNTNISSSTDNLWCQVKSELLAAYKEAECVDLTTVANVVRSHTGTLIPLVKPKSYHIRVCGQDGTVYAGNEDQLEAWKDWYLPERMEMEVIGAIDDFPCDAFGLQLVLLLCEDGNIYAYEDEVLHLVARSLRELVEDGMTFPGIKSFNQGECFDDYSEEEYSEMMDSTEIKEIKEAHSKLRESLETKLLESLLALPNSQLKGGGKDVKQHMENADPSKQGLEIVVWRPMHTFSWHVPVPAKDCRNNASIQGKRKSLNGHTSPGTGACLYGDQAKCFSFLVKLAVNR